MASPRTGWCPSPFCRFREFAFNPIREPSKGALQTRAVTQFIEKQAKSYVINNIADSQNNLRGKRVLITGASSGLGRHFAIVLSKAGAEQTESDQVLHTNFKGAFLLGREFARCLRNAKRGGAGINIASILGLRQSSQLARMPCQKPG